VERLQLDDLFVDLDYVPRRWVTSYIPPEIDQKLFEVMVLYDRDWSLTNAKDWASRSYRNIERMNIRAETHLVDADIYISRASSAIARGDYESSAVFAGLGLESILRIVVEAGLLPFSVSRFVRTLELASQRLDCSQFFDAFIAVSRIGSVSRHDVDVCFNLFEAILSDLAYVLQEQASALDSIHPSVKGQLAYYGNPSFLRGMLARSQSMVKTAEYSDACHYLRRVLTDVLESYAWFAATLENRRLDYTRLFKSLRTLKETPSKLVENVTAAFDVQHLGRKEAEETVELAKDTILRVRRSKEALLQSAVKAT